jgi:acyl-CoA oxidase
MLVRKRKLRAGLLLKEYKEKFSGSPVSATYSYLTQILASSLPQNPLVTHETDFARLRDPAFLEKTLRYRTARLLQTAALRVQKHTARLGAFDVWNRCLSHLLLLATAHIEWVIFHHFMLATRRCKDSGCRGALKCMADIFALSVRASPI